jgi:hypothetical protein
MRLPGLSQSTPDIRLFHQQLPFHIRCKTPLGPSRNFETWLTNKYGGTLSELQLQGKL